MKEMRSKSRFNSLLMIVLDDNNLLEQCNRFVKLQFLVVPLGSVVFGFFFVGFRVARFDSDRR